MKYMRAIAISIAVLAAFFVATKTYAKPLLTAVVKADCVILPSGAVSTLTVTPNSYWPTTTPGLMFRATPSNIPYPCGGIVDCLSLPGSARILLPPGPHNVTLTASGGVSSPSYAVSVPAYSVITLRGRKMCVIRATPLTTPNSKYLQ
jgi:hypothetical protein